MLTPAKAALGARIRAARERKLLSQAELAAYLGRTPTSISYWESGLRSPGLEDVVRLAEVLGVAPAELLPSPPPVTVAARLAADLGIPELVAVVERAVNRFGGLASPAFSRPSGAGHPTEVAEFARACSGPARVPVEMTRVLGAFGIPLVEEPLPAPMVGVLVFVNGAPVLTVRREEPEARKRFIAAHQVGHVLMGHSDSVEVELLSLDGSPPGFSWRHERAANEFAAALLMPSAALRRDLDGRAFPELDTMADHYGVSRQALAMRLAALGLTGSLVAP